MSSSRTKRHESASSYISTGIAVSVLIGLGIWIRRSQVAQTIKQSTRATSHTSAHQSASRNNYHASEQTTAQQNNQSTSQSNPRSTNETFNSSNESKQQSFDQSSQSTTDTSDQTTSEPNNNQWFNFHEAELNRLREEDEWRDRARFIAMKNADWFTIRQAKKRPHYSKWRGAAAKSDANDEAESEANEQKTYRSSSDASYWHWHTFNQQKYDPYARYRAGYQTNDGSTSQTSNQVTMIEAAKRELGLTNDQSTSDQPITQPISPSFGSNPAVKQALNNLTAKQVKKAFRIRAFDTHPDLHGGNDEKFRRVAEAYNLIMSHIEKK